MTQALAPFFRQQFFDQNGNPLSGGKIYFNVCGSTSEFKNTYEDYLGSTLNTNPVILNSSGVAKIYGIGLYDVWIYNSRDELIESILNVDFGGSSQSGTGTSIIVSNYDALRNLTKDYDLIYVLGRSAAFDGGEGWFQLNTNSTNVDDDGIELIRLSSSHYTRVLGDYVDPRWYGVVYGSQIDQSTSLLNSLTGGASYNLPVFVTGNVYLGTKTTITQGTLDLQGSLIGLSSVEVRFKTGSKFNGSKNCLGNNIVPIFEQSVCDALYLSWFTNGTDDSRWSKLSSSTVYNYKAIIDINTSVSLDITLPSNISVDVIGGSKCTIIGNINLTIPSFVYTGKGEIFHYNDISYVGTVKLGDSYCYMEWFGGVSGSSINTDNSIPFLASLKHGSIYLISQSGEFYNIPSGTYTVSNNVSILGNIPVGGAKEGINLAMPSTIRLNGSIVSMGSITGNNIKIDGYGSLVCADFNWNNSAISNTIAKDTGLTSINDTLTINPQYLLVGNSGKILESADSSTWVSESMALSSALNSIVRNGKTYVIVGNNGYIFTSTDGVNWVSRTSGTTNNLYKVVYLNGKFVIVGASGTLLYSTDGTIWNSVAVGTSDLRGISYSTVAGSWITVGASGSIYVSSDLINWTKKVISNVTGVLYDVYSNSTTTTIVGYNGGIYTTTDFNSFTSRYSGVTTSLLSISYYTDKKIWIATSSNGNIVKSIDGINYSIVTTHLSFSDAIYSQIEINGKYLFACGSGYLLSTFDFNTFTQSQPLSNSGNNLGICGMTGKVIAVSNGGLIKETSDLQTWTSQTSGTTVNLHSAITINGVYYILGASGTYLTSYDGTTWTVRSIGASIDIYDMTMNADKNLFVAVGSAGSIYSSINPIADSPVWTLRTSNVTTDLTKIIYNSSTYYVYGKAGTILKSTDGLSWTNINSVTTSTSSNGIISNGSLITVYFGNNGTIRSTVDGTTYVTRTSGTTNNLLSGCYASGKFVIVGASGIILTSTDGITWTSQTSGTSAQLNRVVYLNNKFFVVGSSATIRQSSDAISWSSAVSVFHNTVGDTVTITAGFRGIGYVAGYYYAFGEVGCKICYSSDLSTWVTYDPVQANNYTITAPITVVLNDCYSSGKTGLIFGDGGFIYTFYADGMENAYALQTSNANNWKRVVGDIVIGDSGVAASIIVLTNQPFSCPFVNPLNTETTDNLVDGILNGTNYTIISNTNTFTSPNKVVWTQKSSIITSDIISVWAVDTTYYLISGGKLYSTTDNINFTYIKDTTATNIEYISGTYYLIGMEGSVIETATTPTKFGFTPIVINGDNYSIKAIGIFQLNGSLFYFYQSTQYVLFGGLPNLVINASGKATISDSLIDTIITNSDYGPISNSTLNDIAKVGKCENSTFNNLSGNLYDNISRSYIFTRSDIGISENISLSECSIEEITADTQLFNIADTVTAITLNNCNTILTGMLGYSINTGLSIVLSGGFLTTSYALSNGYAKIFLDSVFDENGVLITKTSAYSNNGQIFTEYSLNGNLTINTIAGWHHPQISNLSNGTNVISVTSDIAIASDINSEYTLRYRDVTYLPYGRYETSGITYMGTIDPASLYQLPQPSTHMGYFYNCIASGTIHFTRNGQDVALAVNKGDLVIATGPLADANNNDISAYELMTNTSPMRNLYLQGGKIVLKVTLPTGYDKEAQKRIKLIPKLHIPNYISYRQYNIGHTVRYTNVWEDSRGNTEASPCTVDGANIITNSYISYPLTEKIINPAGSPTTSDDGNLYWDIFGDEIANFQGHTINSQAVLESPIMGVSDAFEHYAAYLTIYSESDCVLPAGSTITLQVIPCANKQYTDPWMKYWEYRIGNTVYPMGP